MPQRQQSSAKIVFAMVVCIASMVPAYASSVGEKPQASVRCNLRNPALNEPDDGLSKHSAWYVTPSVADPYLLRISTLTLCVPGDIIFTVSRLPV